METTPKLNVCNTYKDLIGVTGSCAPFNVFFLENYGELSSNRRKFLYSQDFAIPFLICVRAPFRYVSLLSEPCRYADHGQTEEEFINEVITHLILYYKIQWVAATPASALFKIAPNHSVSIPFGSHIIDLNNKIESIWNNIHSKHRNVIKKAEKEGVIIVKGTESKLLDDYHRIDEETWRRSNIKASGKEKLIEQVEKLKNNIVFYLAYKDGLPQAGAIFLYNKEMCYYMHGASCNHPFTGSSNLLHWQAIQDMKAAGIKRYSFVGARINEDPDSKYHGIQRFKERFGGELIVGRRFKVICQPFMYYLFVFMVSLKQSFRNHNIKWFRDAIDMELPKWKNKEN